MRFSCEIHNDNSPDSWNDIQDSDLRLLFMSSTIEASCDTTDGFTDQTMTSTKITMSSSSTIATASPVECFPTPTPGHCFLYPESCSDQTQVPWLNGTCVPKSEAKNSSIDILRRNSSNSIDKASALIVYFGSTPNLTLQLNGSEYLTPSEVDNIIDGLNESIELKSTVGFLLISKRRSGSDTVLGGLMVQRESTEIILNSTKSSLNKPNITIAAFIDSESLPEDALIKVFIVNTTTHYKNLNLSNNQFVESLVVIFDVEQKNSKSPTNVSLLFQATNKDGQYSCSFLDENSKWDSAGCTQPLYNHTYNRYECKCNHTTTFALIFLPNVPITKYLTAQDITSLVFQSLSILCFILVITHSYIVRFLDPQMSIRVRDLLPLISSASTTILFIFYIALGMTVYTNTPSNNETKCFLSSSVLMFFVYFFLIFMFCTKTSIGYFNYIRFVRLFPEPSQRKLFILLILSFFISITTTSFAIGFNSNSSYNITQLYQNKLCWFTRDVFHYFMTIPVCIFLLLNFITFTFVMLRIVNHIRHATSPHQSYERMKQFTLVFLASSVTQGIGWSIGPILTFVDAKIGNILTWVFIICNGLEGVWTLSLYIIIRLKHMDEPKLVMNTRKYIKKAKSTEISKNKRQRKMVLNRISSR